MDIEDSAPLFLAIKGFSIEDCRVKTIYNLSDKRFYLTIAAGKRIYYWSYPDDYHNAFENTIFIR